MNLILFAKRMDVVNSIENPTVSDKNNIPSFPQESLRFHHLKNMAPEAGLSP